MPKTALLILLWVIIGNGPESICSKNDDFSWVVGCNFWQKIRKIYLASKLCKWAHNANDFKMSGFWAYSYGLGDINRETKPKRGKKLIFWAGTRYFDHMFGVLRNDDVLRIPKTPQMISKCSGMLLDRILWGFGGFVKFRFPPTVFDPDPESA